MSRQPLKKFAILIAFISAFISAFTAIPALAHPNPAVNKILEALPKSPTHDRIQTKTYEFPEAGRSMEYKLFVPEGYRAGTPAPLIVALHAYGIQPGEFLRFEGFTDIANKRGYIVVAPMGYNDHAWYGSRGTGQAFAGANQPSEPANLGELSEKDVMNVLQRVRADFSVNPKRIYLMGHSMGASGTWYLGIKHPELWAAIAPTAAAFEVQGFKPLLVDTDSLQTIKSMPIVVQQGSADTDTPPAGVHPWVEKMKSLGMTYSYTETPGADHWTICRSPEMFTRIFDVFDKATHP